MIFYHKSNLVYTVVIPQFLIFQKNNSAETLRKLTLTSGHYYFVEKLKLWIEIIVRNGLEGIESRSE